MADDDNRFSPPASEVADVPAGKPRKPPAQIVWAMRMLWLSLGVSVLSLFVLPAPADVSAAAAAVGFAFQAAMLALATWLIVGIWRHKNWARIAYLVLFLLSLVAMAVVTVPEGTPWAESVLNVASTLLDAVAMYLVFVKPGSDWFKPAP